MPVTIANKGLAPQVPIATALKIAAEETNFAAVATTTLEDAGLRTPDERALYALRVVNRVKSDANSTVAAGKIPQKPDTQVIEVARAVVTFAS